MKALSTILQYCDADTTTNLALAGPAMWSCCGDLARERNCVRVRYVYDFPRLVFAMRKRNLTQSLIESKSCPSNAKCRELIEDGSVTSCAHDNLVVHTSQGRVYCTVRRVVCTDMYRLLDLSQRAVVSHPPVTKLISAVNEHTSSNQPHVLCTLLGQAADYMEAQDGSAAVGLCTVFERDLCGYEDAFEELGLIGRRIYLPAKLVGEMSVGSRVCNYN
jgi:hypothetical protein